MEQNKPKLLDRVRAVANAETGKFGRETPRFGDEIAGGREQKLIARVVGNVKHTATTWIVNEFPAKTGISD
jgi:hypothetical protein